MIRADICSADDFEALDRLQAALRELGCVADDNWHDSPLGSGLTRFRMGDQELTVFKDAWFVDVHGPRELVVRVLAAMSGRQ